MQLTKHTDFAFRTLIYLASNTETRTNIQTIADRFDISKSHLMKVVSRLVSLGWVYSSRGNGGGLKLAVDPAKINLAEVVRKMETTLAPVNCQEPVCAINEHCTLKPILWQAQKEYFRFLEKFTLQDVINDPTLQILKIA
jgi:Rrf2 family nitric oxide-sensitive transcriptional repressor